MEAATFADVAVPLPQCQTDPNKTMNSVFGARNIHPQTGGNWGNVNSIGIRTCYPECKRAEEKLCYGYPRPYGINIRVARIFNASGRGMSAADGRVSSSIDHALKGEDLTSSMLEARRARSAAVTI